MINKFIIFASTKVEAIDIGDFLCISSIFTCN